MTTLNKEALIEKMAKAICWKTHEGRTGLDSPQESWAAWHSHYETLAQAALRALAQALPDGIEQRFSWEKPEYYRVENALKEHLAECKIYRQLKEFARE